MIVAIIQARYSSSRLPGKVLKPILGRLMLSLQIERVVRSQSIDHFVVATSSDKEDEPIRQLCNELGIACFSGSLNDVLDRFYKAAAQYIPDHVIRLTGDCPLIDPQVIDSVVRLHLEKGVDYTSNINPPTFPDGLDVEIMRFSALEKAWKNAKLPSEREHVTPYIRNNKTQFSQGVLKKSEDLSGYRWTVDEADDFEFVTKVYEKLYPQKPDFLMADVLQLLKDHPGLAMINAHYERNAGMKKTFVEDQQFLSKICGGANE